MKIKILLSCVVLAIHFSAAIAESKTIALETAGTLATHVTTVDIVDVTELTISNHINKLDFTCLDGISSLQSLSLRDAIIDSYTSKYDITYPANEIPDSAFLTSCYENQNGVTVFTGNKSIKSIVLPTSILSIGASAFNGSVATDIDFSNCKQLTLIKDHAFEKTGIEKIDLSRLENLKTIGTYCFCETHATEIILDGCSALETLDERAFCQSYFVTNTSFKGLTALKSIGNRAFLNLGKTSGNAGVVDLTECTTLETIDESAFQSAKITGIKFPASLKTIGAKAFNLAANITEITFEGIVPPELGATAFTAKVKSNATVYVPAGSKESYKALGFENVNENGTCGDNLTWTFESSTGTLTISGTGAIESSPWWSFQTEILNVVIGVGVTSIGDGVFAGCSGLMNITIPEGITSIGSSAFENCSGLTSITIPNGVTSIGRWAFKFCSGLTSITIPDGLTSIDDGAFGGCSGLTNVTIPDGVTTIGDYAFADCRGLTSINIPHGVTTIGDYAFADCIGLANITIPDGVTSIGSSTFSGCRSLTSITIPESLTYIGNSALYNCNSLSSALFMHPTPPSMIRNLPQNIFIYVPPKNYEAYVDAGVNQYFKLIALDDKQIVEYKANGEVYGDGVNDYLAITVDGKDFYNFKATLRNNYCDTLDLVRYIIRDAGTMEVRSNNLYYDWNRKLMAGTTTEITQSKQDDRLYIFEWYYMYNGQLCKKSSADVVEHPKFYQDKLAYSISDGNTELIGATRDLELAVIPATVTWSDKDYAISAINENAFNLCEDLSAIVDMNGKVSVEHLKTDAPIYVADAKGNSNLRGFIDWGDNQFTYSGNSHKLNWTNRLSEIGIGAQTLSVTGYKQSIPKESEDSSKIKNGDDVTYLMANPGFDDDEDIDSDEAEGWTVNRATGGNVSRVPLGQGNKDLMEQSLAYMNYCFEAWCCHDFDIWQEVRNAPVGMYEIECQGYARCEVPGYTHGDQSGLQEIPFYLYTNSATSRFPDVYSENVPKGKKFTSVESWTTETVNNKQYPNSVGGASQCFSWGMYKNRVYGIVAKKGNVLRIGVKGTMDNDWWCIWDSFKLTYHTVDTEILKTALEKALKNLGTIKPAGNEMRNIIEKVTRDAQTAMANGNGTEMLEALGAIYDLNDNTEAQTTQSDVGEYTDEVTFIFTYQQQSLAVKLPCKYTITPAPLTAEVQNTQRVYGQENPKFEVKYTGLVNGETEAVVTKAGEFATEATVKSDVGEYDITYSGAEAKNYIITPKPGKLTVTPAKLTAKVNESERVYGDENPKFGLTLIGLINGDKQEDVMISAGKYSTTATKTSAVGEYTVKCSDVEAKNYEVETVDGNLYVMPAKIIARVNNSSKTYGAENPEFTARFIGFRNGEDAKVLTRQGTFATQATAKSEVGEYKVTLSGAEAMNYTFEYEPGTLTVTKAPLTAKADDASRLYYTENPTFTVSYDGFVNGDDERVLTSTGTLTTTATKTSNVGTYPITLKGVEAKNYEVTCLNGALTIEKGQLTATVENATKIYGDDLPDFKITLTGMPEGVDGSSLNVGGTVITAATKRSDVGDYKLTLAGVWSLQYDIETVDGTLTITPAPLTAKVGDATKTYGEDNPQFTSTFIGFVNGDTERVLTNKGSYMTTATKTSDAGQYDVMLTGAEAKNYVLDKVEPGVLTIEQAEQQIFWNQELNDIVQYNQVELTATATSGLPVSYQVTQGTDVCSVVRIGSTTFLDCFGTGDVTVSAWQEGNKNYYPTLRTYKQAEVVSTTISSATGGSYRVTVKNGLLLIDGLRDADTVNIYDLAGRLAYSGHDSEVRITRGCYIVRIGHWQQKVVVK